MNIKHSIGLNLSADAIPGRLHMVQGDANSRTIVATLWDGAQPYSIPAEAAVMVRFRKPDGTGGLYDTTESGNKVSYAGSIVTAPVATQMLAVAGDVFAEIDIFGSSSGAAAERLATFRFVVEVSPCVLPDAEIISSDYYNILAADIADAKAAADLAKDYAASAKQSADSAAASVEGTVKYNAPQTLTDEQKQQARDNINAPAPYTAGENISISGSVIATKAFPCNPNLLDNWYLGNPVNQRGQTEWLSSASVNVPCVDRWNWWGQYVAGSTLKLLDDGLQLIGNPEGGGLYQQIVQKIEKDRLPVGATVTLSALVKAEADATIVLSIGGQNYAAPLVPANTWTLIAGVLNVPSVEQTHSISIQRNTSGTTFTVKAVKLELGSQQTLAHQENGVWVLNEIPDYGEQLRRCQRYYFKTASAQYSAYLMRKVDNDYLMDSCIFPVEMRTTPALQLLSYRNPTTGAVITAEGDASQITPNGFCVLHDAGKFADSSVFQVAFSASADL